MSPTRLRTLLAVGLTATLLTAGCGNSGGTPAAASGEPVHGGTLTFYDPIQYAAWVPTASIWSNSNVAGNVAERLIWQDPATGDFKPWLAQSWEVSDDKLSYTFKLRSGVTFSNGDPLDAETVKLNFDQHGLGDEKLGIPKDSFWTDYAGTEVVDAQTVTVKIAKPNAAFLQILSNYRASSILGKPFLALDLAGQGQLTNWVGTGPFTVEKVDGTTGVTLKRRDDYNWAPEGSAHTGKAYLERIVYKSVPEAGTRVGALQSGEAQISRNIAPYDEQTIVDGGGKVVGISVQGETNSLKIQQDTSGPTQDQQVRLALQAATDRAEINRTVLSPSYPIPSSALVKGTPFRGDASAYLTYDLAKATSLLEAAGWKAGADGVRVKDGKRLEFEIWVAPYYQVAQAVLELLQAQWKKAGVDLRIRSASQAEYTAKEAAAAKGTDDDWAFEQGQTSTAEANVLRVSLGAARYNALRFLSPDPTLESLLDAQAVSFDPAERKAAIQKVEDRIFEQAYLIPLYDETQVFGLAPSVHGFATESTGRTWLYDTWLDE
ncbi:ABC transporter substrate-binding protein [Actinoplanes subglobosus]|uniref:ABC transporter substrate-binding protein n=1 Tax=Actinoplanes subglobosus TaxID=1547892 RepID=A0ABV8IYX5_9ACTN